MIKPPRQTNDKFTTYVFIHRVLMFGFAAAYCDTADHDSVAVSQN